MINLNRLKKLEAQVNEHRRQKRERPTVDYSLLSDEELNSLYDREVKLMNSKPSKYADMSCQELSDLYMAEIKRGQDSHDRSTKNRKK